MLGPVPRREAPSGYLDLADGSIRLIRTKNGEQRTIPLTPELAEVFREQRSELDALAPSFAWVFFRTEGLRARQLRDFRSAWEGGLERTGLVGRKFHDLRRSAVRNLNRAGIRRATAMQIVGHKTEAIHDDYDGASEMEVREAMASLPAHNAGDASDDSPGSI